MEKKIYWHRDNEQLILKAAKNFPIVTVYGMRQVGKSTSVRNIFAHYNGAKFNYATLDDANSRELALSSPKEFLASYQPPLIIDEVQKAPMLLDEIKRIVDEHRYQWLQNGQKEELLYVLTGSNKFDLKRSVADSLAGRTAIIEMSSFTQMEALGRSGHPFDPDVAKIMARIKEDPLPYATREEIFHRIFRGGMPKLVVDGIDRKLFFHTFLNTYMTQDVAHLIAPNKEMDFRRFLSYLAMRTAQTVNYEVFAREMGLDSQTIRSYLSILVYSGLVCLLAPYLPNPSKRLIKSPKLYFLDTGLAAYLARIPSEEMLRDGYLAGPFFETFVVSEIIKGLNNAGFDPAASLFFYRDIDQREIDLIYDEGMMITPIEIKAGTQPHNPTKNFAVLDKYPTPHRPGIVIDCEVDPHLNPNGTYVLPVHLLGY